MATFSNQATLTYSGMETNSNVVTGELLDVLSITKTALSSTYRRDGRITYVISVVNTSASPFGALSIADNLGAYSFEGARLVPLSYVEGSVRLYTNGILQPAPMVSADENLVMHDLSIPANGNILLFYDTAVNAFAPLSAGSTITNTVRFSGCGVSTALTASVSVSAESGAFLTISKSIFPIAVTENGSLTYTFVIQNTGSSTAVSADNVVITDTFDPILSDISVTYNGAPWSSPEAFTYNPLTGRFTTGDGQITVPAATYVRDNETGRFIMTPGVAVVQVTGTV